MKSVKHQRRAYHKAERQLWRNHGGRERTLKSRDLSLKGAVEVRDIRRQRKAAKCQVADGE